jgi:hypothetical protein
MRTSTLIAGLALLMAVLCAPSARSEVYVEWRDPSPHAVRWVTVDGTTRLEVLDWGGSGRIVVLLGCYLTAHVYDDFAPKLTNQFHAYGITRRALFTDILVFCARVLALNRQGTTDRRTVVGYWRPGPGSRSWTRALEFYRRSPGGVRVRDVDGRSAARA